MATGFEKAMVGSGLEEVMEDDGDGRQTVRCGGLSGCDL